MWIRPAALTAIQHNLRYLVLDERDLGGTILHYPRQKLVMTQPVEIPLFGWLKKEEYSKEFLMDTWQSIADKFQLNIQVGDRVDSIHPHPEVIEVRTQNKSYFSYNVVLAMGRRGSPRKLEVPGEELSKVMYQLVDAQSFTGKHMLVVGGGESAVEAAAGLARQKGNIVTISYRKSSFLRLKKKNEVAINHLIARKNVHPLLQSQVKEIRPQSVVLETVSGPIEIPNDFVIVQIGGIPPFEMLKAAGIQFGGNDIGFREKKLAS